jgi:hypothetical protein
MMTFVIRNGLASLKLGRPQYQSYVLHMARAWALTDAQVAQVCAARLVGRARGLRRVVSRSCMIKVVISCA